MPVPVTSTTGNVVVTINGVASNGVNFVVPPPTISDINPQVASVGNPVTISGAHFGATQAGSIITFNGVTATPTTWSDSSILVPVPTVKATTGNIVVTVNGVASSGMPISLVVLTGETVLTDSMGRTTTYGYQAIDSRNFVSLIVRIGLRKLRWPRKFRRDLRFARKYAILH